jgi:hypothetical protein
LGAVSRSVYDQSGNIVQQWLGTNDIGATDDNPHSQEPDNDMRLISETMYGHTGSCSSCGGTSGDQVLVQIQYSDNGQSRATEYKYDWRGRQTHTLGEEDKNSNYIQTVQYYDNLDRIVKTEQYLCQEKHHERQTKQRFAPHI